MQENLRCAKHLPLTACLALVVPRIGLYAFRLFSTTAQSAISETPKAVSSSMAVLSLVAYLGFA